MNTRHTGFTIIELLIVVIVISILAAITVASYNGITQRANDASLTTSLQQAAQKVVADSTLNSGIYPTSLASIGIINSSNTTYDYTVNTTSPIPNYCITVTQGNGSNTKLAHIAGARQDMGPIVLGVPCNDHQTAASRLITANTVTSSALGCPAGYIAVPGNSLFNQKSFCVMKYEAKNDGSGTPISVAAGAPWASISQPSAMSTIQSTLGGDYGLITDNQWLTIAHNAMTQPSNWTSGTVGSGFMYRGHTDNAPSGSLAATSNDSDDYNGTGQTTGIQRRTLLLSNSAVIWDFAGNVYESTQTTTEGPGKQAGLETDTASEWKQWRTPSLILGVFATSVPSYGNAEAINWTSTSQSIGQLYSDANESGARAVLRGGTWNDGSNAGVTTINLGSSPTRVSSNIGFRVSR